MGIFQRLRAAVARSPTAAQVKMVTETGNGLYVYDGNLYKSDIVRACIRPKIKAVGKATPRHIRTTIGPDEKPTRRRTLTRTSACCWKNRTST